MDSFIQDVRYAVRTLSRTPSFTAIAVLTIAIGVGATSAIFSIVDNLLFRPPPFPHAQRLVSLIDTNPDKVPPDAETPPSPANLRDWRERVHAFDAVAAWRNWYYSVTDTGAHPGQPAAPVRGVRVSPSFFPMIGVHAALGRTFRQAEGQPGRDDVVVLSHSLWTRRFGANPGIVGSRVLEDAIAQSVPRFQVELLALFGAIALLLSAIGVYGVTSYGVSQRTREIGIRMSLGATARDVSFDVLHEAALIGVIGVIAGLVGAAALGRAMASMLYGVSPMDGASLATAAVVLFSATILAAYVPARRAARVQPIVALRSE